MGRDWNEWALHGGDVEYCLCGGSLPSQTAGMGARPVEAPRLKRAGPLVAIDHPSSPSAEAFRAGRTHIGPSLEKPTGALPTALAGARARVPDRPMGQRLEFFVPPRVLVRIERLQLVAGPKDHAALVFRVQDLCHRDLFGRERPGLRK